jgi:hypothetical protein
MSDTCSHATQTPISPWRLSDLEKEGEGLALSCRRAEPFLGDPRHGNLDTGQSMKKREAVMGGKVFISCGINSPEERKMARRVRDLLNNDPFNLTPYVAITVQSLDDIMTITNELRSSDYYLFIDFNRAGNVSMFTHQELALAHHLGFASNIIALRETGAPDPAPGFLNYVLSNPEWFSTRDELIEKVRMLVSDKGWAPNYSRNLVVDPTLTRSGLSQYGDHTGQVAHESWRAKIHNRRPEAAAVGAVCILDSIRYLASLVSG